jgi:glycosyltransferase involved in cell wall biosynthesis
MISSEKLVTVIIPTKNRIEFLRRAISSVQEQTYQNIEIIVVDDASDIPVSFDSFEFGSSIPIKIIRNERSLGGAAARNIGIDNACGEFLSFLDDDDYYINNKIQILLENIGGNDFCFGEVLLCDKKIIGPPIIYPDCIGRIENIWAGNIIHTGATLIRKTALKYIRFNENLKRYQDTQFHIELMYFCSYVMVHEYVAVWNVDERDDQITSNNSLSKLDRSFKSYFSMVSYLEARLGVDHAEFVHFYLYLIKLAYVSNNTCTILKLNFLKKLLKSMKRMPMVYKYRRKLYARKS